jgi:hypothetical protein
MNVPTKPPFPPSFDLELEIADINNFPIATIRLPVIEGYAPLKMQHDLFVTEQEEPLNALRIRVKTTERPYP